MEYPKSYLYYKELVLSKTNGTNIHTVNGLLGVILNSVPNIKWQISQQDFESAAKTRDIIKNAEQKIQQLTNVPPMVYDANMKA
jgi:hypothetical protein